MDPFTPHGVAAPETAPDDPRLGHWLARHPSVTDETRVALLGFPSDAGVARNGGRPGAAEGPAALRRALYKLTADACDAAPFEALLARTADIGDVPVSGNVERDQAALGQAVASLLDRDVFPIVLGGGHETLYGHALGYLETGRPLHLLNWDAHADVRPLIAGTDGAALGHSGSPFRQALQHPAGLARGYTVAGLQPWRVSSAHAAFVRQHGRLVWTDDLSDPEALVGDLDGPTLASFDLDAVEGVSGVSAPNVAGISVAVWLRAAEACGRSPHVTSADVVELSPPHDASGQAATLAALTVWHLLRGLSGRAA